MKKFTASVAILCTLFAIVISSFTVCYAFNKSKMQQLINEEGNTPKGYSAKFIFGHPLSAVEMETLKYYFKFKNGVKETITGPDQITVYNIPTYDDNNRSKYYGKSTWICNYNEKTKRFTTKLVKIVK